MPSVSRRLPLHVHMSPTRLIIITLYQPNAISRSLTSKALQTSSFEAACNMASSALCRLPIELLVHIIATYLSTKDLGSLRLTSRYLETALFDTFAKEFFTKKQFM